MSMGVLKPIFCREAMQVSGACATFGGGGGGGAVETAMRTRQAPGPTASKGHRSDSLNLLNLFCRGCACMCAYGNHARAHTKLLD